MSREDCGDKGRWVVRGKETRKGEKKGARNVMNHRFLFFNSTTQGETGTFSVSAYPFRTEIISLRVQYSICIITVNDLCPLPCLTRCVSTITSRCTRYLGLPAVLTSREALVVKPFIQKNRGVSHSL